MNFEQTALPGVLLCHPVVHADDRGCFLETYRRNCFHEAGVLCDFVQENEAYTKKAGTLRGLHYQATPFAQAKLLRVLSGAILDVVVDVHPKSLHFGRSVAVKLAASDRTSLFVPAGYAHGYITLTEDVLVSYKVDRPYAPSAERSVRWNDPTLGIDWGITDPLLSDKDRRAPPLSAVREEDFPAAFLEFSTQTGR